jgi:transposase
LILGHLKKSNFHFYGSKLHYGKKGARNSGIYLDFDDERIIQQWYREYPFLKASQVFDRLKGHEFQGSYSTVCIYTRKYRQRRNKTYHELEFLPGEEAQIDWMEGRFSFGTAYGFVFLLAYSRYLYVRFYPRHTLEFFLDGHIEAFREIGGVARSNRYDNLKTVVISRRPEVRLNTQFLDFARHYGFSIHVCNPYRANEKGRVERVIRDIREFLRINIFKDISHLNKEVNEWRRDRNNRIHRATGRAPAELLKEENLKHLPVVSYAGYRSVMATVSKTGFIEFDSNRYSVPSSYTGQLCEVLAYPEHVEIMVKGRKVATHRRVFGKKQKVEHPSHRQRLLAITAQFKYQRIYQLIKNMDKSVGQFLDIAEAEGEDRIQIAYELFRILRNISRDMLVSAIRQANELGIYKVKYIKSILQLPDDRGDKPVYPQDMRLLEIDYERRQLKEYDELI